MQMKCKQGIAPQFSVRDYLNPAGIPHIYWVAHPSVLQFHFY